MGSRPYLEDPRTLGGQATIARLVPAILGGLAERIDALLTTRRVRSYAVIFLIGWSVAFLAATIGHGPRNVVGEPVLPDFLNHWTGGRLVLDGYADRLYDAEVQQRLQDRLVGPGDTLSWFVAPPFAALFYVPFAALPYLWSALIWTLLSAGLLALALHLARPLLPRLGGEPWPIVLLAVAASQPVFELIGSGQDSAVNLALWIAGVRLALARRDFWAGALLAVGLHKPHLFFLPPILFLLWRRPRAVLGWTVVAGALGAASILLVGLDGVRAWLELLVSPKYRLEVQAGQSWKMQSIPALLTALVPRELATPAELLGILVGLSLVVAVIWLALRHRSTGPSGELAGWSLACLTTLLASPHVPVYDLALLALPALWLLERANTRAVRLALVATFILTWTLGLRYTLAVDWPWPASILSAPWTAVALLTLWIVHARTTRRAVS